jgi:signal transduction histidine kinase
MSLSDNRFLRIFWPVVSLLWLSALIFAIIQISAPETGGRDSSVLVPLLMIIALAALGLLLSFFVLTNIPYLRSLERRSNQLDKFFDAIRKAASTLDLQEIFDTAAKVIVEVTEVKACSIELLDENRERMKVYSIVGIESGKTEKAVKIAENIYHSGLMEGKSVIVRDVHMRDYPAIDDEIESLMCVPLRVEDRILGAVCVFGNSGQRISNEMISLLSNLASVISLSIAHVFVFDDLKALVNTKTWFMLQTSHELRSPLSAIQSIARTMNAGYLGELSKNQQDAVSRIERRAQVLSETVGDLLSLAKGRAEFSTLKLSRIDLNDVVKDSAEFYELGLKEKNINLALQLHDRRADVYGNRDSLLSIVTNLLSNAIKYSPKGGQVVLRLYEREGKIVLEVKDTGMGIPKDDLGRIFEEFYRTKKAKSTSQVGTGLGLAIVKSKVEQHGGIIEVESEEEVGTTFRVSFLKASE